MRFERNGIVIDADTEKTEAFYKTLPSITYYCDCDGCTNYEQATEDFPKEVKDLFASFGIDPKKAAEVYVLEARDKKSLHYGGFYHFCGTMLKENGQNSPYSITDDYHIAFTTDIDLPEEELELPALQMEIDFVSVPWKLEKENTY